MYEQYQIPECIFIFQTELKLSNVITSSSEAKTQGEEILRSFLVSITPIQFPREKKRVTLFWMLN